MSRSSKFVRLIAGLLLSTGAVESYGQAPEEASGSSHKISAEDEKFFEAKIRPVLVGQCYSCHSGAAAKSKRLKGGLFLDSRAGVQRGGESGPAIDTQHPENSLILDAIKYGSIQMPPQGKLAANVISDFEKWVGRGAPDPRSERAGSSGRREVDLVAGRQHWAYRPIANPVVPHVRMKFASHTGSSIDSFVLAQLSLVELNPTDEADRTVLIRRLAFDLVGLPPSPEEIDEFLADSAPDAFERLVDRLIASPHFGERWGRHWLSVARYAESVTLRGMIFSEAWRYRDYVIDSFNSDRPFRQFIAEQLAGDLLPVDSLPERQRNLIATAYLSLGNINLEEQDKKQLDMDVVDEQLDAISKGFLAQTVTCARCHDHKFDPIPTRDYYALAGILANTKTLEHANVSKWMEFPLPLEPEREATFQRLEREIATLSERIKGIQDAVAVAQGKDSKSEPSSQIIAVKDLPGIVVDDQQAKVVGEWQKSQSNKPYIGQGYIHDQNTAKGNKTVTLLPELHRAGKYEVRLAYTHGDNRSEAVPVTVFSADGEKTITVNQKQRPLIDGHFISLGQFRFELNGQGFVIVSNGGTTGHVIVDAVQFLPVEMLTSQDGASAEARSSAPAKADTDQVAKLNQNLKSLQQQLDRLQKAGPKRPMYMSVQEGRQIADICINVRGIVHNRGDQVPRGFLQVTLPEGTSPLPTSVSGRKELAEWIASRDNPLTARVLANRVWYWLFGKGLVATTDNFGTTGELPTHPELLEHLASRLHERDWSVKDLVRRVVASQTYRQASASTSHQQMVDPENRWLSHQNRRRLDPECLLDAILSANGRLHDDMGGNTIRPGTVEDYNYRHQGSRRAVYWPVFRNSLPEIFEVFDFADPSVPTGQRHASTVAPQALFALNDDWIIAESTLAANRLLLEQITDTRLRIDRAFRLALGRDPSPREAELAANALKNLPADQGWAKLFQALFATIDFRYVE